MRENYYTAAEAAKALGLEYHTFMWRVREKGRYPYERIGTVYFFDKAYIDQLKKSKNEERNAANR